MSATFNTSLLQFLWTRAAAAFFTLLCVGSLLFAMPAKPAEAQLLGGGILGRLFGGNAALITKEFQLDAIAYQIAQGMLSTLIQSTIDWVNSGFQGSPAFITDLKEYLLGELDAIAGEFLQGSALGFLCQPFEFNVRLALQSAYQESQNFEQASQCTISGAIANVQSFFQGNFSQGGWQNWFEVVYEPQNNAHGAFALGYLELTARLGEEEVNMRQELNWGDGFRSVRDPETGRIVTPGAVIADRVNSVLAIPEQSLINADEINELISALMNQLATQVMSGFQGLAGMSQGGAGGQGSFTSQLGGGAGAGGGGAGAGGGSGSGTGGTSGNTTLMQEALTNETAYVSLHRPLVERLTQLETRARAAEIQCPAVQSLLPNIVTTKNTLQGMVTQSDQSIARIQGLITQYQSATTAAARTQALYEFESLRASGSVRTAAEVDLREIEVEEVVKPQIDTLEEDLDDALDGCGL